MFARLYANNFINYIKQVDPKIPLTQFKSQSYHQAVKRELIFKILPYLRPHNPETFIDNVNHFDEMTHVVSQQYDRGVDLVGDIDKTHTLIVHCKQNLVSNGISKSDIDQLVALTALYKTRNFQKESLSILASPYILSDDALKKMNEISMNIAYAQVSDLSINEIPLINKTNLLDITKMTSMSGQLLNFIPNKKCSETFSMKK